jgi:hypothetical protein
MRRISLPVDTLGKFEIDSDINRELQPEASCESLPDVESYLNDLLLRAAPAWESIPDADAWLAEIRGTSSLVEM